MSFNFKLLKKRETKISKENAEKQLARYLDYHNLEEDDVSDIENYLNKLVKAVMQGRLEFKDEEGRVIAVQHLSTNKQLVYAGKKGVAKMAMKDSDISDHFGKVYSLASSLAGMDRITISQLPDSDIDIVEAIGFLFLQ